MAEKNEHDYTPDEYARVMAEARADMPPSKPSIELDEGSGQGMVEHAQQATHVLGRMLVGIGKTILKGQNHPEQIKIGFDYDASMAYVEVDIEGIAAIARADLEDQGLVTILDSVHFDQGSYRMPANHGDTAAPMPRATYRSAPVSAVRLYLDNGH